MAGDEILNNDKPLTNRDKILYVDKHSDTDRTITYKKGVAYGRDDDIETDNAKVIADLRKHPELKDFKNLPDEEFLKKVKDRLEDYSVVVAINKNIDENITIKLEGIKESKQTPAIYAPEGSQLLGIDNQNHTARIQVGDNIVTIEGLAPNTTEQNLRVIKKNDQYYNEIETSIDEGKKGTTTVFREEDSIRLTPGNRTVTIATDDLNLLNVVEGSQQAGREAEKEVPRTAHNITIPDATRDKLAALPKKGQLEFKRNEDPTGEKYHSIDISSYTRDGQNLTIRLENNQELSKKEYNEYKEVYQNMLNEQFGMNANGKPVFVIPEFEEARGSNINTSSIQIFYNSDNALGKNEAQSWDKLAAVMEKINENAKPGTYYSASFDPKKETDKMHAYADNLAITHDDLRLHLERELKVDFLEDKVNSVSKAQTLDNNYRMTKEEKTLIISTVNEAIQKGEISDKDLQTLQEMVKAARETDIGDRAKARNTPATEVSVSGQIEK